MLSEHLASTSGPMVLNLWASWCIPCRTEMPDLDRFARDNPNVHVLGVAVQDSREDTLEFADEVAVGYPLAFGNRAFEESYPVFGLPVTYVISPSGVVTALHRGILNVERLEDLIRR